MKNKSTQHIHKQPAMILHQKLRIVSILLFVLTSAVASAQFIPQRVVAFKNGLSFLHERGTFPTEGGEIILNLSFPNYAINEAGKLTFEFWGR